MTRSQLGEFKRVLETEQVAAAQRLMQSRHEIAIEKSADALEEIWYTAERELVITILSRHSDLLRNIQAALRRIDEGNFGVCLCCGETIGLKRLTAVPWTPFCIRCQEAADRNDAEVLGSLDELHANAA